jgi:hypothetical protein
VLVCKLSDDFFLLVVATMALCSGINTRFIRVFLHCVFHYTLMMKLYFSMGINKYHNVVIIVKHL